MAEIKYPATHQVRKSKIDSIIPFNSNIKLSSESDYLD